MATQEEIAKMAATSSEIHLNEKKKPGRPAKAFVSAETDFNPGQPDHGGIQELLDKQKATAGEILEMTKLVQGLKGQLDAIKNGGRPGATVRNRIKEHFVTMREFTKNDEVLGIVTNLYNVKEVKDTSENKRYMGLCSVDVMDPRTKKTWTEQGVDYLVFLENATRVSAKILNWRKEVRFETDLRKGGGGFGALYKQGPNNEYLVDSEYEYEVGYSDQSFTLQINAGEFEGLVMETDGKGNNI